jgi:hypothetical protein
MCECVLSGELATGPYASGRDKTGGERGAYGEQGT